MACVSVALCICTCRRPDGLERLLNAVAELDFAGALTVIVVDNDAARDGIAVCQRLAADYRWPLLFDVEERQGISYARNRAIARALEQNPAFIANLDDDEWPERGWLRELLRAQAATNADVVGGPVRPWFPPDKAGWAALAGFYGAGPPHSREPCLLEATGNFMARAACFEDLMPTPFDPAFAFSGGEDLVFFRRLAGRGWRMAWAAEAVVDEAVPPSRMSLAWLRQRQFRRGNLNVKVQRMFAPGVRDEAIRLTKTAGLLVLSLTYYLLAWPHRTSRVRASLLIWKALGKIMGHLGHQHQEYTRIHGR